VNTAKRDRRQPPRLRSQKSRAVLPILIAVGGGLVAAPVAAIELGDLAVQSKIGQPLRASIAYALGPNEMIDAGCVTLLPAGSARDIPQLMSASISISGGLITVAGRSVVTEPMLAANIAVNCPYTAHVSRSYLLFLDPLDATLAPATRQEPLVSAGARRTTTAMNASQGTPLSPGERYRVLPGDSLSRIVSRLRGAHVDATTAMNSIFEANPRAFIAGDPDRLQAGSWIEIPSFAGNISTQSASAAVDSAAAEFVSETVPAEDTEARQKPLDAPPAANVYDGAETLESDAAEKIPASAYFDEVSEVGAGDVDAVDEQPPEQGSESPYAGLVAGDVIVEDTRPMPAEDATAAGGTPVRTVPAASGTRIVGRPAPDRKAWDWLIWIAVAGISAFGGYLLLGPRLRERFGSKPIGADTRDGRPMSAHGVAHIAPISVPEPTMSVQEIRPTYDDVDFDLSDDSPTQENLALDADLVSGSGFDEATDVAMNQDFGFAVTTQLDIEIPESSARENDAPQTDIIPPLQREPDDLIVNSEVMPEGDDEYDISMIVDATKMPNPEDVTERDLKAVPIDPTGEVAAVDAYTINRETDLDILEQDYEDEMTATQALNAEIEKAAMELAASMDDDVTVDDTPLEDDTAVRMQLTDVSGLAAQNDDIGDDDLAVTANITADDKTVEMPKRKGGA